MFCAACGELGYRLQFFMAVDDFMIACTAYLGLRSSGFRVGGL